MLVICLECQGAGHLIEWTRPEQKGILSIKDLGPCPVIQCSHYILGGTCMHLSYITCVDYLESKGVAKKVPCPNLNCNKGMVRQMEGSG